MCPLVENANDMMPRNMLAHQRDSRVMQLLGMQVSLSAAVMPMVKMVPRGFTAAADAYLTPHILRCGTPGLITTPASSIL